MTPSSLALMPKKVLQGSWHNFKLKNTYTPGMLKENLTRSKNELTIFKEKHNNYRLFNYYIHTSYL